MVPNLDNFIQNSFINLAKIHSVGNVFMGGQFSWKVIKEKNNFEIANFFKIVKQLELWKTRQVFKSSNLKSLCFFPFRAWENIF